MVVTLVVDEKIHDEDIWNLKQTEIIFDNSGLMESTKSVYESEGAPARLRVIKKLNKLNPDGSWTTQYDQITRVP